MNSQVLKNPKILGRPNSLLYDAAPIGASNIISRADLILDGLVTEVFSQIFF